MDELKTLDDLEKPVVDTWWAAERREARRKGLQEGRREGRQEAVIRSATRKFGRETARRLAKVLEGVSDSEQVGLAGDLVIDCATGEELLAEAAKI